MLRIIQSIGDATKGYYTKADYYLGGGQEMVGQWGGKGAEALGLAGTVDKSAFDALCDNLDPRTGKRLTARNRDDRTTGYDFNWHAPKSVSLLYGLTEDAAILDAFRVSVADTMRELEAEMLTRVRTGGKEADRVTGNLAWAEFIHFTARPVGGIPDPHLHAHCFAFNATHDAREGKWKAGQFRDVKRDAPYFQAAFHARLSKRLNDLGYPIQRSASGWEIAGFTPPMLKAFSRRTEAIERLAAEKGIDDAHDKSALGAKTRSRKESGLSMAELRELWSDRLGEADREAFALAAAKAGNPSPPLTAEQAIAYAIDHCFERDSAVPEKLLVAEALKIGVAAVSAEDVRAQFQDFGVITARMDGRLLATTRDVIAEERRMTDFAARGRGNCKPLGDPDRPIARDWLNAEQRAAIRHLAGSRDRVMLLRGGAGAGKTSLMQEAVEAIEAGGRKVFAFAPSTDASRGVLRDEGFEDADTVARLLLDTKMQDAIAGQVLWIDEAGLLGTRTLARVFDLAAEKQARVILSGDDKQHGAVERGDCLRVLERLGGVVPVAVREIQRQKGDYKAAVTALAAGKAEEGFDRLDALGWVHALPEAERTARLAGDYAAAIQKGESALVVSPTHAEGAALTAAIRGRLKQAGTLNGADREMLRLENRNLTEAQRGDAAQYRDGDVLVFHQNAKGFKKGDRITVAAATASALPLAQAGRFQVFHAASLALAPGDKIRFTANGTARGGKRLNNGAIHDLKGFDASGNLVLGNGWVVDREFGHLAHGYVVTSHASQGKTVDRVFIGQSAASLPASSREQFYVTASRARKSVTLYTDDKAALKAAIAKPEKRVAASDLVAPKRKQTPWQRMRAHLERVRRLEFLRALREEPMIAAPAIERSRGLER